MAAGSGPFERLWSEYQNTGDKSARAKLAERFLPLLVPIAKKEIERILQQAEQRVGRESA